jgi:hypothetical protein
MRRPAALARGEPNENGDVGKPEDSNAAAAWQVPAPSLLADLELVADWKEDLTRRMARGQFILETIGLSTERHDELIAEAQAFIRVCRVMAERVPGSLIVVADHLDEERRAA